MVTSIGFNGYTVPHARIIRLEGLDTPPYRTSVAQLAGARGAQFNRNIMDKRSIVVEFLVKASSMASYLSERANILSSFLPDSGEKTLTLTINETTSYTLECAVQAVKMPHRAAPATYVTVQVQLLAANPIISGATLNSSGDVTVPSGGGFTFPVIFPITFEQTASGSTTLTNSGNVSAYPTIVLSGVMTNPLIRNVTTGEVFQLTRSFVLGDITTIDMQNHTAVLNGTTSVLSSVVAGSDWWDLEPGSNQIAISTSSISDTGTMAITWYNAYNAL